VTVRFNGGSTQTTAEVSAAEPGQALAINQDGTVNTPANPAARGSVLTFWATGQGTTQPASGDGQPASAGKLQVPVK
jgi:uncharacterized protein (TIGR03437 family)